MASALDAVLGLIAQEKQQEQFKSQQLTAAVEIFQRARELAQQNQIAKLQAAQNARQLEQQAKYQNATIANQEIDNARQQEQFNLQKPLTEAQTANLLSEIQARKDNIDLLNRITSGTSSSNNKVRLGPGGVSIDLLTPNEVEKEQLELNKLKREELENTPEGKALKLKESSAADIQRDYEKQLFVARKAFDTYQSDAFQALVAIDKIETQAKKLPDFKRGVYNQLTGGISAGIKSYSKDKDVTRYVGVVAQELIPMARKLMEEKGPITEWDVDRVERGLGDLTTPLEDKMFLLNELRNKVKEALSVKSKIAEIPKEDIEGKYSTVFNKAGIINSNEQEFNPMTHKKQINKKTGEIRIVPK